MKLKAPKGRVVVKVDMEKKNQHSFADGTTIYIGRKYNNLNRRETEPINCDVVDGEGIPEGSEILCHHNALHETYRIYDYEKLSGEAAASDIQYFSVEEQRCYLWREPGGTWEPLKGYATALRVYKPYKGFLMGIEPEVIKNVLLITSGEHSGKVCHTLIATDYELIFQGDNNQEARMIRCRHYEDGYNEREELTAVDEEMTRLVHSGELIVGLSPTTADIFNEVNIYG